jgi:hypothetical protein
MIEAIAGQGGGRFVAESGEQNVIAQASEQVDQIRHAALGEIFENLRHQRQRGVAERGQLGVEPLLAGDGDEGDPSGLAFVRDPLETLGEVSPTAEHPHDHGPGVVQILIHKTIQGFRGKKLVGVPGLDGRKPVGKPTNGRGQGLDLGIGGREDQEHGGPRLESTRSAQDAPGGTIESRSSAKGRDPAGQIRRERENEAQPESNQTGLQNPSTASPSKAPGAREIVSIRFREQFPSSRVSARSSGLRAVGASSLPTRSSGQWREIAEAPFPITAAGPRRYRTGFPSTETLASNGE